MVLRFINPKTKTLFFRFFLPVAIVAAFFPIIANWILTAYASVPDGRDANAYFLSESVLSLTWSLAVPALFVWTWFGLKKRSTDAFFESAIHGWKSGLWTGVLFFAAYIGLSAVDPGLNRLDPSHITSMNFGGSVASNLIRIAVCVLLIGWGFLPPLSEIYVLIVIAAGDIAHQIFRFSKIPTAAGVPTADPIYNYVLPASSLLMIAILGRRKGLGGVFVFVILQLLGGAIVFAAGYTISTTFMNRLLLLPFPFALFISKNFTDELGSTRVDTKKKEASA